MEGLELEPGVSQGFSCAQWPKLPYQGYRQVPRCRNRSPEVWVQAGSVPCKCALLPPSISTFAPEGSNAEARGGRVGSWHGLGPMLWQSLQTRVQDCFQSATCMSAFTLFRCSAGSEPALSPILAHSPWQQQSLP